jgi:hypothetical protein
MANWTPQQIVDALHEADGELKVAAQRFAWFKGQKDFWKSTYELQVARSTFEYAGPTASTRAKPYAEKTAAEFNVEIPWIPGHTLGLLDMKLLTEASFDLVSKEYNRLETHIMILMAVNKNVMQDYASSNVREQYA